MTAAELITVGTWREEAASMGRVLAALDRLRRSDRRGAVRTSFLTLLAVGGESIEVDQVFQTVHRLGPSQPSRVVVVRVVRGEEHRLDARVGVHLLERGDRCLGVDDIALEVAGPVTAHLDSVVQPLTLPDLPLVLWCWERLPPSWSPLIDVADHLVVDTARAGGCRRLPALARLHRRVPVVDLAWLRLLPLRRRLAAVARRPEVLAVLDQVTGVAVGGSELERALLLGWLGPRFPGATAAATADLDGAAAPASVTLDAGPLQVRAEVGDGVIATTVAREGEVVSCATTTSPPVTTEALLASALQRLQPDPVFAQSLEAAAAVA